MPPWPDEGMIRMCARTHAGGGHARGTVTLRLRFDPGQRAARPVVGRRHGAADLPGRGPVVFDQLSRAASGPDDHLVQ